MNIQTLMYIHNLLVNAEYKSDQKKQEALNDYRQAEGDFGPEDGNTKYLRSVYEDARDEWIRVRDVLEDFESVKWR